MYSYSALSIPVVAAAQVSQPPTHSYYYAIIFIHESLSSLCLFTKMAHSAGDSPNLKWRDGRRVGGCDREESMGQNFLE